MTLLLLFLLLSLSSATAATSSPASCPVDLSHVFRIAWNKTTCLGYNPPKTTPNSQNDTTKIPCCQSVLSLFGVALAKHLKDTSQFQLPSAAASLSCLSEFQAKLSSLGIADDVVSFCLTPEQFVIAPDLCARIRTLTDWVSLMGPTTELDFGCRANLTDLTSCDGCVNAGTKVLSRLISIDGNASHSRDCWYFTILYAAGIVNEFGPESNSAVSCILGLSVDVKHESDGTTNPALLVGLTGGGRGGRKEGLTLTWRSKGLVGLE